MFFEQLANTSMDSGPEQRGADLVITVNCQRHQFRNSVGTDTLACDDILLMSAFGDPSSDD